jgi:hypothetical protein
VRSSHHGAVLQMRQLHLLPPLPACVITDRLQGARRMPLCTRSGFSGTWNAVRAGTKTTEELRVLCSTAQY